MDTLQVENTIRYVTKSGGMQSIWSKIYRILPAIWRILLLQAYSILAAPMRQIVTAQFIAARQFSKTIQNG